MISYRSIVVNFLRRFVKVFAGVLLSQKSYDQIILQRANAVSELVKLERGKLSQGVVVIVFSKDRALQLYTLLHTYFQYVQNPVSIFVIYTATNLAHAKAYKEVQAKFFSSPVVVKFVREATSFRDTLLNVLCEIKTSNIFFLVDDIIFIRNVDLDIAGKIDPNHLILSLRHSPNLRRSYTANTNQMPPRLSTSKLGVGMLEFNWFEEGCEWSDPWSLDGQVLSTAELRVISRLSDFNAPNSYENALKTFNDFAKGRAGVCFSESKILNLPINRVQNEVSNQSGNVSPEFLLQKWNEGMMLDTTSFEKHVPLSPHEEHVMKFMKRL